MADNMVREGDPSWANLKALWVRNGGEYIEAGGKNYRVFTPNGEESPIFQPQDIGIDAYGRTSTGVVRGAEPKNPLRSTTRQNNRTVPISDVE